MSDKSQYDIDFKDDAQFLQFVKDSVSDWFEWYAENIERGIEMRNFTYGDDGQWSESDKSEYAARAKSRLTLNVTRTIVRQLVGENMQNKPAAQIVPANSNIKSEQVELVDGLHRQICYDSNFDMVIRSSYKDALDVGYGAYCVKSYQDEKDKFNNQLRYELVPDCVLSFFDPSAESAYKTDGDVAGKIYPVKKRRLSKMYDDANLNAASFSLPSNDTLGAADKDSLVVCEIYYREYYKAKKIKVQDEIGNVYIYDSKKWRKELKRIKEHNDQIQEQADRAIEGGENVSGFDLIPIPQVIQRITAYDYKIHYALCTTEQVLERKELPIKKLPVVFVPGDVRKIGDREITQPFAMDARVPQQMVNYTYSCIADNIKRSVGTRILAEENSIENNRDQYVRPNESNLLTYQTDPETGQALAPSIINGPSYDPNLLSLNNQAKEDVQMAVGRYGDNAGDQTNAESGVAINARTMNGNLSAGVYPSNLAGAIGEGAKIMLEWMPHVYDTHREIKTMGPDGNTQFSQINVPTTQVDSSGEPAMKNTIDTKSVEVHASGGMSFTAQTMNAINFLMKFTSTDPNLKHITYDIIMKLASRMFDDGERIVSRLYSTGYIDPQIIKSENLAKLEAVNPSAAQQIDDMMRQMQEREMQSKEKQAEAQHLLALAQVAEKVGGMKAKRMEQALDVQKYVADYKKDIFDQALKTQADLAESLTDISESIVDGAKDGVYVPQVDAAQQQVGALLQDNVDFVDQLASTFNVNPAVGAQ